MPQPIQDFSNPAFTAVLDPNTFPANLNFPVTSANSEIGSTDIVQAFLPLIPMLAASSKFPVTDTNLKIVSINIQAFPPLIAIFTDQSMSASNKGANLRGTSKN